MKKTILGSSWHHLGYPGHFAPTPVRHFGIQMEAQIDLKTMKNRYKNEHKKK